MDKVDPAYSVPDGFDQPVPGRDYGYMETICYNSTTTKAVRKASVLLPADYDEKKSYPVLYLLHGIGGDHREWLEGKPQYVIGNLVAEGEVRDLIVVMPNVRARKDDRVPEEVYCLANTTAFDNFIHDLREDLMPYIEAEYPVLKGREHTSVAGLSMGGERGFVYRHHNGGPLWKHRCVLSSIRNFCLRGHIVRTGALYQGDSQTAGSL